MVNYYECHITMNGDPEVVKPLVELTGWRFSAINGDMIMGKGIKCYATMLYSTLRSEKFCVDELIRAADFLVRHNVQVTRRKMERVIYDDKTGKCDGACCPQ